MSATPRLLVFQHLDVEHPGIFREFLAADGIPWDVVELDRGEAIPDLRAYDGLWVLGGPLDVWEESAFPWLAAEKSEIRRAVLDLELPFLGVCLGHQLLATALGGKVAKGMPEVGVMPVELTPQGRESTFFNGMPTRLNTLQWHAAEVTAVPPGAVVMARSPACAVQALAIGDKVFSIQFHVEVTNDTVAEWATVPAYAAALEDGLGAGAVSKLQASVDTALTEFNAQAKTFYDNWMGTAGLRHGRPATLPHH